jgi:hypothetical protein
LTTSKALPGMVFRSSSASSFQRVSEAPEMNQFEQVVRHEHAVALERSADHCTSGEWPAVGNDAFMRRRSPIGGRSGFVSLDAKWVAGWTYARWVFSTVNRSACRMAPARTSS